MSWRFATSQNITILYIRLYYRDVIRRRAATQGERGEKQETTGGVSVIAVDYCTLRPMHHTIWKNHEEGNTFSNDEMKHEIEPVIRSYLQL